MRFCWKLVPLKQITRLTKGTEPGSKNYLNSGKIRLIRISDLTGSRSSDLYVAESEDLVIVKEADILFALDGTPGIVARGFSGAISSGIRKVESSKPEQLLDDYLYFALQSRNVQQIVQKYSKGVTIKHASSLKHMEIPIPSMDDQERIVKKLQAIEEILKKQKSMEKEAFELRESILDRHLTLENAATKKWEIKSLEEVCDEIYRYPTFYGFRFIKSGAPVIKISNFTERGMLDTDLTKYDYVSEDVSKQFPRTILKRNDLVMGVRGTYIGKCVLIPSFLEGANMSPNLLRMSPNRQILRPQFLWHFTCSSWWNEQINRITYYWKLKFGTIRSNQLKQVIVPVPKLDEQDLLLQQMDGALNAIKEIDIIISNTSDLLKSMIDKTFTIEKDS